MKTTLRMLIASLVGLGGIAANASTIAAVQSTNGTAFPWREVIGAGQSATIGWSFVVGSQPVELSALGIFDLDSNGLEDAHPVGIWNSSGTLLSHVTVPSGAGGTLVGSYRYVSVAPLTLAAGQTYVLGAYFGPVANVCGSACGDSTLAFGTEVFAPGIAYRESDQTRAVLGAGSLSFPGLDAGIAGAFFGPNFLLTAADPVSPDPVSAPEPAALGLAGAGICGLLARAFRRKGLAHAI